MTDDDFFTLVSWIDPRPAADDAPPPDVWADVELVDALAGELEAHQRVALEQLADETDAAWAAWLNGTTPYGSGDVGTS